MVAVANPAGNFPVVNGALPCEGTQCFPFNLDFTGGKTAYLVDLTQQYQQKQFTTLQTVFIDNSESAVDFDFICTVTGQTITAPPFSQGYYPILQPVPPKFNVNSASGVVIQIILLNFYIPPEVWQIAPFTAGGIPQVDIPALDPLITAQGLQVVTFPGTTTMADHSGTITTGGTGQLLLAANANRKRFTLTNPTGATAETLQFAYANIANGYIDIPNGQTWDENNETLSQQAIYVKAATTAHAFVCYEGS